MAIITVPELIKNLTKNLIMKKLVICCVLFAEGLCGRSQSHYLDSLKAQLQYSAKGDSNTVLALFSVADYYGFQDFDSCLSYARKTLDLSEKIKYPYGGYLGYLATFHALNAQANYAEALQVALKFQNTARDIISEKPWAMSQTYYFFGLLNREMANYEEAKKQLKASINWQQNIHGPMPEMFASFSQLGIVYLLEGRLDSALYYAKKGYEIGRLPNRFQVYFPLAVGARGNVFMAMGRYDSAKKDFDEAIQLCRNNDNYYFQTRNFNNIAVLFRKIHEPDSAIFYANESLVLCLRQNFQENLLDASKTLASIYDSRNQPDSALKYMKIVLAMNDSVFSISKGQKFQQYAFNEIQQLQKKAVAKERYQQNIRMLALGSLLLATIVIILLVYRGSLRRKKDKLKIEHAFNELKLTQAQLIQSEKMASLGELTAGIAHEIQNPLNFVNNFSEVSTELIDEMKAELSKANYEDANSIADDLKQNLEKINHHGKRADSIVKGMLEHSKTSTGKKEPTDINKIADEYLRLAYHGLRAKDKSFNAIMKTDYDERIGKINIISQDIGRVLLNLYNNAFYAVNEKQKTVNQQKAGNFISYEPTVSVSTKNEDNQVIITVSDNGNGIPQKIVNKIFQPFFTTKPTGQGTGLGLSLSYDIIKAHGGGINVKTKEGEGTGFIILLPIA